jgi:hypothetical protein
VIFIFFFRKVSPPKDQVLSEDPFDTSFAENIAPGKAELKIIESEILREENDLDFDPRAEDKLSQIITKVSIKVTDPAGQRESISSLDRVSGRSPSVLESMLIVFSRG